MHIRCDVGHIFRLRHRKRQQRCIAVGRCCGLPQVISLAVLELADLRLRIAAHHPAAILAVTRLHGIDQVHQLVRGVGTGKGAGHTCRDISRIAPGPGRLRHLGIGQKTLGLVHPVTIDKGIGFLFGEHGFHFPRQPLIKIDNRVIQQSLRRSRHGIKLHGRILQFRKHGGIGLRTCRRFTHPTRGCTARCKRFLVKRHRTLPHIGNRTDGRSL